jgi:hypothetical protein
MLLGERRIDGRERPHIDGIDFIVGRRRGCARLSFFRERKEPKMIRPNDHRRMGASFRNHNLHHALGSCCSECAATGGSCGGASLGDVSCDQDNNCYDSSTGIYTPAPVFSASAPLSANVNSATTWLTQNSTMLAGLAAVIAIAAYATGRK